MEGVVQKMNGTYLDIDYDIISNEYWYGGDVKRSEIIVFLSKFFDDYRKAVITGDNNKIEEHYLYSITIQYDIGKDKFFVDSNCGDSALLVGILDRLLDRLYKEII